MIRPNIGQATHAPPSGPELSGVPTGGAVARDRNPSPVDETPEDTAESGTPANV